jgi:hypothetical protein
VSKESEWFASLNRQTEDFMGLQRTSQQHPEIGSVALRMLWIPAVASILIAGYLGLRSPQDERASPMAVATAKEMATPVLTAPPGEYAARDVETAPALPDESIAQQQALDPVGAGHDVAR